MSEKQSIVKAIFKTLTKDLSVLATKSIREVTSLIGDNAEKIVKKVNILDNRWVLINLLHVLYRDIFLLQNEDFVMIINSSPKHLDKNLVNNFNIA